MSHYITTSKRCQDASGVDFLSDRDDRGKERPWTLHKLNSTYISYAFQDVNKRKAYRVADCASSLFFSVGEGGRKTLKAANFCRVRLCPMCSWRRSLKTKAHMLRILSAAQEFDYRYIMVTLTVKNCAPDMLASTIDLVLGSFRKLVKRKELVRAWNGWYRGLEVTHNLDDNTYHPHLHVLVAVNKSYFTSRDYIAQSVLTDIWQSCLQVDYTPVVDVRRIYAPKSGNVSENGDVGLHYIKAVSEVAKYTTKAGDIICHDDWDLTVETVAVLDKALNNRRLIAFGGKFKELHRKLNLDDTENGDLVNLDDADSDKVDDTSSTYCYFWNTGYSRYVRDV